MVVAEEVFVVGSNDLIEYLFLLLLFGTQASTEGMHKWQNEFKLLQENNNDTRIL